MSRLELNPSHRRQQLVAAIIGVELSAALALDRRTARGGRSALRDAEGTAQAVCALAGLAGGKGGAGCTDADYQQRSGDDLDRQSHGKPPVLAARVCFARTGARLNPGDPTGFRTPIISPKADRRCREIGPVLA